MCGFVFSRGAGITVAVCIVDLLDGCVDESFCVNVLLVVIWEKQRFVE